MCWLWRGHFLSTCTKIKVGRVCETLKKKVKKVVQEKCEQWTGEMNPNPNPSDMNVTFATIDDEIDDEIDNENVNDSESENSVDDDVEDY